MAKNKKFKRQYLITVEGVTTNDFAANVIDDALTKGIVPALDYQHKQVNVTIQRLDNINIELLKITEPL